MVCNKEERSKRKEIARQERVNRDKISYLYAIAKRNLYLNGYKTYSNPEPKITMYEITENSREATPTRKKRRIDIQRPKFDQAHRAKRGLIIPGKVDQSQRLTDCKVLISRQLNVRYLENNSEMQIAKQECWNEIINGSVCRWHAMDLLQRIFGRNSSDPNGWVSKSEAFFWLDDFICYWYSEYHHILMEEESERSYLHTFLKKV